MAGDLITTDHALLSRQSLHIGIVGDASGRARYGAALAASPSLKIVGVADADVRHARAWARDTGGKPPVFPDLSALLDTVPDIDALLIALPLERRTDSIVNALRMHKSVLCEFPFASCLPTTDTLIQAAAESGALLMPVLPRRCEPYFQYVKSLVETETSAAFRHIRCDWSFPVGLAPAIETGSEFAEAGWHTLLQAVGCQTVDVCRWWLGEALTVSGDIDLAHHRSAEALVGKKNGAVMLATFIVTHERGQSTHHLSRSRSIQADERYVLTGVQSRLELIVGAGEATAARVVPALTQNRPGQRPLPLTPETDSGDNLPAATARLRRLLLHFADCVLQGATPAVRDTDARAALEIVHAAYLSTQEDLKIGLPLHHPPDLETLMRGGTPRQM
jgi:predicted dehydrogenase